MNYLTNEDFFEINVSKLLVKLRGTVTVNGQKIPIKEILNQNSEIQFLIDQLERYLDEEDDYDEM